MPIIHALSDAEIADAERRASLFSGNLFVYSPRPCTQAFSAVSRAIIEQMLGPDPVAAQQRMSEDEFAALFDVAARNLSRLGLPLAAAIVTDLDCDPDTTFVGAPCLVASTGLGFLAHGLGVPRHPHRDTWYAASPSQLNWWIPLYGLEASNSFAFHSIYWELPVQNNSGSFDYQEWHERSRMGSSRTIEASRHPRPLDPIDLTPEVRISCPAGGVILSSVAQLYSAVPNETGRTHFSVHFQTVNELDLLAGVGATNLDADPQGSALREFVRCSDLRPIPVHLVERDLEDRRRRVAGRQSGHPPQEIPHPT